MDDVQFYGIWEGDGWTTIKDTDDYTYELLFRVKRHAQKHAAKNFGLATYSEAKRKGWVEVRPYTGRLQYVMIRP